MSEAYIDITFTCESENCSHWQTVFDLLAEGQRGWKLQDAIDPISEDAADALDQVWGKLSHGTDSFEVFIAAVEGDKCHLKLMTGGMAVSELEEALMPWFKSCPVKDLHHKVTFDGE